jgi:ribonuclease VapC
MVIDTSALVCILQGEPEGRSFNEAIEAAPSRSMSAATFVEVSIVLEARHGAAGVRELDAFLERAEIGLVEFDLDQARLARDAFRRFGKGRHPAGLNYGDCFSYALSMALSEPLLYKGNDFARTDVLRVEPPPPA